MAKAGERTDYGEQHDLESIQLELDMAAFSPMQCVELAESLVKAALTQGLPFPVDVDGEAHLRAARRHLKVTLHEFADRTKALDKQRDRL